MLLNIHLYSFVDARQNIISLLINLLQTIVEVKKEKKGKKTIGDVLYASLLF